MVHVLKTKERRKTAEDAESAEEEKTAEDAEEEKTAEDAEDAEEGKTTEDAEDTEEEKNRRGRGGRRGNTLEFVFLCALCVLRGTICISPRSLRPLRNYLYFSALSVSSAVLFVFLCAFRGKLQAAIN